MFADTENKKNLQKLNNPVKTLVTQNSLNQYPLSLSIQFSFEVFSHQNLECLCLQN